MLLVYDRISFGFSCLYLIFFVSTVSVSCINYDVSNVKFCNAFRYGSTLDTVFPGDERVDCGPGAMGGSGLGQIAPVLQFFNGRSSVTNL